MDAEVPGGASSVASMALEGGPDDLHFQPVEAPLADGSFTPSTPGGSHHLWGEGSQRNLPFAAKNERPLDDVSSSRMFPGKS